MTCLEFVQPVDFAVLISNETIGGGSDKYGGGGDVIVGHDCNKGKGVKEEGGSFDHRAVSLLYLCGSSKNKPARGSLVHHHAREFHAVQLIHQDGVPVVEPIRCRPFVAADEF